MQITNTFPVMTDFITATEARKNLFNLVDKVADEHEPQVIKGKRNTAVLISQEDWDDIQETLFVEQNTELAKSLIKNANSPDSQFSDKIEW